MNCKKDVHQIKAGKPYQYVIGFTWFYDLKIEVNESVLIPRPETEELVHWIIQNNSNKQNLDIIDIGTGSGCIALTLKSKIKNALVTGVDISEEAIAVAQKNAELNQLQVHFELFDVLQYLPNKQQAFFDVVVSNPPYIPENEQVQMDQIVTDHEPAIALFTPKDQPLLFYEHICRYARQYLKPGGFLYFEMHENYGTEVEQTMNRFGFEEVTLKKDMQNKLRMIRGRH